MDKTKIKSQNLCLVCKKGCEIPDVFSEIPEGCYYAGVLFQQQEKIKQKVRKKKERLLELQTNLNLSKNPKKIKEFQKEISEINDFVNSFSKYGAKDW